MSRRFVYHPAYLTYCFGPEHPFSPRRQEMLLSLLEALGALPPLEAPPVATAEELLSTHDPGFVAAVAACSVPGVSPGEGARYGLGTTDVPLFPGMDEAARWLVGGTLHAARLVGAGEAEKALSLGGGLHHAQRAAAAGFCVYSDLSVAIRHLTARGLRVAYLDVDVHHGDGVQALHYDDPDVLTISLHQTGRTLYPGTGFVDEIGEHGGRGYKLNVPLEPKTTDDSYLEAFETVVPHALAWFAPDVFVVQAGADAHFRDPLADLLLTTRGFERLFRRILELSDEHAHGRAVLTLGGGYRFDAAVRVWAILVYLLTGRPLPEVLPEGWRQHWEQELGRPLTSTLHDEDPVFSIPDADEIAARNETTCKLLLNRAAKAWY